MSHYRENIQGMFQSHSSFSMAVFLKARSRQYFTETNTDVDYADELAVFITTQAQAEYLLHSLEQAARGISLNTNEYKTEYISFKQKSHLHFKWEASKI